MKISKSALYIIGAFALAAFIVFPGTSRALEAAVTTSADVSVTNGSDDGAMHSDTEDSMKSDGSESDEHGAMMKDDHASSSEEAMENDNAMSHDGESMENEDNEHGNDVSVAASALKNLDASAKADFLATVKTHAEVASGQDLQNFAKGVLLKDENVESVSVNGNNVDVEYKAHGKLLGFIPHTFTEKVSVNADANASDRVKVRFPWYGFLLSSDVSASQLVSSLGKDLEGFNPLATGGTNASSTAQAQATAFAQLLDIISGTLKASANQN